MRTRSEWFLTPIGERLTGTDSDPTAIHILRGSNRSSSGNIGKQQDDFRNLFLFRLSLLDGNVLHSTATALSASAESIKRPSLRRTCSKEKQRLHRSSSRRNKENGAKGRSTEAYKSRSLETMKKIVRVSIDQPTEKIGNSRENVDEREASKEQAHICGTDGVIGPQDCTEMDVQTFHVTLTYKPRI